MTKKIEKLEENEKLSSSRGQFLNPQEIVSQLGITPGMRAAHFGAGTGFFTFPLAKAIGEKGEVWALDIMEHKLELIKSQARAFGLTNITTKRVNLESQNGSQLEDNSMNWVIIVNMLHQNKDRSQIVQEARRILCKGGKMLFIDWNSENGLVGPKMKVRVTQDELQELLRENHLEINKEVDAGKFCFGVIVTK